ncbi:MAG: ABC transporter permease [Rhodospirillaceae bacterium]|mgnify:CR=1 FL=1|jgi:tungstate transport system permease protein|nr:ABC transporter permease [Rhodospirillaceae bacterium]MBT5192612.1 ABC transporter permease [Rhodospirillaceae bacterium]MBT5894291.1 ABC transporter permease [Rhodospirillaceae bacterium]MBT6430364.1 ABC transporter permease [Rhodospirillaceae bacterium]MBT7759520.1 ABC transporter permease [Rhodospirillaceae bacterium]
MDEFWHAIMSAGSMIWRLDTELWEIIGLSLRVSLTATGIAAVVGLPFGALIALGRFPGRRVLIVIFNALMGLPPVVVGLVVYLMLSRSGPFGVLNLLFTPTAMIIAQIILVLPIIVSLSREVIETLWQEYHEALRSLGASPRQALFALLWDGRVMLVTTLLAGFGRAVAEVGAVMIVGGNIDHVTRVMTTSITLEASKGNLSLALGLGVVLLLLSLSINIGAYGFKYFGDVRRPA